MLLIFVYGAFKIIAIPVLIGLVILFLTGCASVFDTPSPTYNANKITCSAKDMEQMLVTLADCKKQKYSDKFCFDISVVKHCGTGKEHKLFTGDIEA